MTRKVEIPKGDIVAIVQPPRMQGPPKEKLEDYAQRILNAQGEASNAKAKVIADAINAKFKDDFAKLPAGQAAAAMASAGFTIVKNRSIIVPATRGSVKEGIRADGVPRRRRERPRQEHRVACSRHCQVLPPWQRVSTRSAWNRTWNSASKASSSPTTTFRRADSSRFARVARDDVPRFPVGPAASTGDT